MLLSFKSFVAEKKHVAMQKLFIKKRKKKKRWKKWTSVRDIENNGYLDAPVKKREKKMNKIAHVLLQSYFQFSKGRYVFKEHSRIKLATTYIHHTSTHMHILIWLYDKVMRFDFTIYVLQVCSFMLFTLLWAPHKP